MKAKVKQYISQIQGGQITTNNLKVLAYLLKHNETPNPDHRTIYHMRINLGMAHQTLTSRISDLMDLGMVRVTGDTKIKDKHYSLFAVVPFDDIRLMEELATMRLHDKIHSWIGSGLNYPLPESIKVMLREYRDNLKPYFDLQHTPKLF